MIQPAISRAGLSAHTAFVLPNDSEGYVEANFIQNVSSYSGAPATYYSNANTGIYYPRFSTASAKTATNAVGSEIL